MNKNTFCVRPKTRQNETSCWGWEKARRDNRPGKEARPKAMGIFLYLLFRVGEDTKARGRDKGDDIFISVPDCVPPEYVCYLVSWPRLLASHNISVLDSCPRLFVSPYTSVPRPHVLVCLSHLIHLSLGLMSSSVCLT